MKAMMMAAGLGTRLKPWTLKHPKALVPVCGVPALERLILRLKEEGFDRIVINVHHFSDQVKDFLAGKNYGVSITISDETDELLDTGGALAKAAPLLLEDDDPVLVHNVDILSNQYLSELVEIHQSRGNDITLLTSGRESSRKLVFDSGGILKGWHRVGTEEYKPSGFVAGPEMAEEAFSGIYVLGPEALRSIMDYRDTIGKDVFPVMDYLLSRSDGMLIRKVRNDSLHMLDIGKPEALAQAEDFLMMHNLK